MRKEDRRLSIAALGPALLALLLLAFVPAQAQEPSSASTPAQPARQTASDPKAEPKKDAAAAPKSFGEELVQEQREVTGADKQKDKARRRGRKRKS